MKNSLPILFVLMLFFSFASYAQDEFKTWDENNDSAIVKDSTNNSLATTPSIQTDKTEDCSNSCTRNRNNFYWVIGTLLFTVLAGIFMKFNSTRKTRMFFLIGSIAILGFYRGSCPCPVAGIQETLLLPFTNEMHVGKTIWFVGLIPITYFFGRVWCGWVCQLGALQEIIFSNKFNLFTSPKSQKVFRTIRIFILVILVIQLLITKEVIWNKYDPFKAAFNLFATNTVSWILLGLLLLSSVLIYRPFCKSICPVGLALGWISKIPGASNIKMDKSCINCKSCERACKIDAITYSNKCASIVNQDCIACGECMDACRLNSLHIQNEFKA